MAYLWIISKKNTVYCSPSIYSTLLCGDMNLCEGMSLITNPQRTKLCWLWSFLATGAANSFYMLQSAWSRTGSFSKGLRSARRRGEELCKAHTQWLGGISVAEVVWIFSHTPRSYSTKRQHARLPFISGTSYVYFHYCYYFPPRLFFLISATSCWLGECYFLLLFEHKRSSLQLKVHSCPGCGKQSQCHIAWHDMAQPQLRLWCTGRCLGMPTAAGASVIDAVHLWAPEMLRTWRIAPHWSHFLTQRCTHTLGAAQTFRKVVPGKYLLPACLWEMTAAAGPKAVSSAYETSVSH